VRSLRLSQPLVSTDLQFSAAYLALGLSL
jgi:hypothetical protein